MLSVALFIALLIFMLAGITVSLFGADVSEKGGSGLPGDGKK